MAPGASDDEDPITLPPDELELDPEEIVLGWARALDHLDYLTLMRLPRPGPDDSGPTDDDVRDAFRDFALAFHPDRHVGASPEARAAASKVFQRGAEAYRVLQDPVLRKRYLRAMTTEGVLRMPADEIAQSVRGERGRAERVQDVVKSAAARPFAERADELLEKGDVRQAKLQLQLALMREPQNARLQERMRDVEADLAARTSKG